MGKQLDGIDLRSVFAAGVAAVERELATLNRLNVFPVPDADTGTNMVHTVRGAARQLGLVGDSDRRHAGRVARAFASGAFSGARGNSGVIFAEILRGFAHTLDGEAVVDGPHLVAALAEGSRQAYLAVSHPVEGTMLTVMDDTAAELKGLAAPEATDPRMVLRRAAEAARRSVRRTPDLMPLLRENGVVDAGALGIAVFLDGMVCADRSEEADWMVTHRAATPSRVSKAGPVEGGAADRFGFCTEFVISGAGTDAVSIRSQFEPMGNSLVIAGDQERLRVHVHTDEPGKALTSALKIGSVTDISIRNMDEQAAAQDVPAAADIPTDGPGSVAATEPVILAFAPGAGFATVFESLGARVFPAHESGAFKKALMVAQSGLAGASQAAGHIIVIPCDPDVAAAASTWVRAAETGAALDPGNGRGLRVHVINTETAPAGIAALMAYTYAAPINENVAAMDAAAAAAKVIAADRVEELRARLNALQGKPEIATLYYAGQTDEHDARPLAKMVAGLLDLDECEVVFGGQGKPRFLLALE